MNWRTSICFLVAASALSACSRKSPTTPGPAVEPEPSPPSADVGSHESKDSQYPKWAVAPPADWQGSVFEPRHRFPHELQEEEFPWASISFRDEPERYLRSVLEYSIDGNIDSAGNWQPENNPERGWYHVPWMTVGHYGREAANGLTRERTSLPGELAPTQVTPAQSWAIGYFNPAGAYAIGQVWQHGRPVKSSVEFPEGTVSIKLLFSDASVAQVPYLAQAPEWDAFVHASVECKPSSPEDDPGCIRAAGKVRLLQVDLAVKDRRAASTGWVFGTYVYHYDRTKPLWDRLEPVGVMWGNDPDVRLGTSELHESVAFQTSTPQHLGCGGRINGPVDNPQSSCLACHARAGYPELFDFGPDDCGSLTDDEWAYNFTNVKYPATASPTQTGSYDYSLQLSFSVANFFAVNGGSFE